MSKFTQALLAAAFTFAFAAGAHAQQNPEMKADAQAIDSACAKDAEEVGCGGKVVGKGMLKCMHEYKEAHKDHKFSEGCRDAMKKMREERKEEKGKM